MYLGIKRAKNKKKAGAQPTFLPVTKVFFRSKKTAQHPLLDAAVASNELGADNGIRTRGTKLGKLVLYQLSYVRSTQKHYTAIFILVKNTLFFTSYFCKDS